MFEPKNERIACDVRRIYNYNVGQKAALGWVLLVIFVGAGFVMALATVFSLLSGISFSQIR